MKAKCMNCKKIKEIKVSLNGLFCSIKCYDLHVQTEKIFKEIDKIIKANLTTDEYDSYNIEADIENFVIDIEKSKSKFLGGGK